MASLLADGGRLFVQFRYRRQLCREYLGLKDTRDNRREKARWLQELEASLRLDTFDYAKWFPKSKGAARFQTLARKPGIIYLSATLRGRDKAEVLAAIEQLRSMVDDGYTGGTFQIGEAGDVFGDFKVEGPG